MKKTFILFASVACMTSCINMDWPEDDSQRGMISLTVGADDDIVVSRSSSVTAEEDLNKYQVTVTPSVGSPESFAYSQLSSKSWSTASNLTYTVDVNNYTNNRSEFTTGTGRAFPVYQGSLSGITLIPGGTKPVTIDCQKQKTAVVSIAFTDDFKNVYKSYKAQVTGNGRTVTFDATNITDAYFMPGTDLASNTPWTAASAKASVSIQLFGDKEQNTILSASHTKGNTITKELESAEKLSLTYNVTTTNGRIELTIQVDGEVAQTITEVYNVDPTTGNVSKE